MINYLPRKGAFQLSLGLIVSVVFAVILLSLAITWLTGMIGGIEQLTYQTSEVAQQRLLDQLSSSGTRVGIAAPDVTTWKSGDSGSFTLGIRNEDVVNLQEFFVCIYCENCPSPDDNMDWFETFEKIIAQPAAKETVPITIQPTAGTTGTFLFRIVVNMGGGTIQNGINCKNEYTTGNTNYYGSEAFALEIE
jgi:hypothetical protein